MLEEMFRFSDFVGNTATVVHLRRAIASGRLPSSILLSGPAGSGKYTLSLLLTMSLLCENQPREAHADGDLADFCGHCRHCTRIAEAMDLPALVDAAVAAREEMRETDKKETRVLIQTHPDVLILPPDPPQLLVKLGQVRSLIHSIYSLPGETKHRVYLFPSAAFMKEAANSLLKVLEEPPAYAHIILMAEHPGELLPTIRSRCAPVRLGALSAVEIEELLATQKPEVKPAQRNLIARLAQGAAGKALSFDLEGYLTARADAMVLLRSAVLDAEHTDLFKTTETYRAGADGQQKTQAMLAALAGLLEDLLLLRSGVPDRIRNVDMRRDLDTLADSVTFEWLENALRGMDQVISGMRRNLLRSLSLDAFAEGMSSGRR
ncbi:DNA polymerase-3 subunit delta' [Terriglobus roseus]|uniref:DNA polymerase-3 subunit delta n=2 Tax=Terriglobus roseus TaxID=392734 RepID=A0A1G7J3J0_9BACT|nr:DNA polymerase-3 subunit delta' [Terriglobus roseus]